ncbi:MAG: NUDIX domain-containing protein, partial [Desulfococcus multivorans]|nr:NUDIX domain-containing protein [Desulfococcus multivorans]
KKTGLSVDTCGHLGRIRHAYTHFKVLADLFIFRWRSGSVCLDDHLDHRWVGPEELTQYPLPKTHHKFMSLLVGQDFRIQRP